MPSATKLAYTAEEVAELLGIGRTKVYELMRTRELETIRIGRSRRVPAEALARFVRDRTGV